jgi:hypothetical protein
LEDNIRMDLKEVVCECQLTPWLIELGGSMPRSQGSPIIAILS